MGVAGVAGVARVTGVTGRCRCGGRCVRSEGGMEEEMGPGTKEEVRPGTKEEVRSGTEEMGPGTEEMGPGKEEKVWRRTGEKVSCVAGCSLFEDDSSSLTIELCGLW